MVINNEDDSINQNLFPLEEITNLIERAKLNLYQNKQ